jgi:voltage-gated potassium channel
MLLYLKKRIALKPEWPLPSATLRKRTAQCLDAGTSGDTLSRSVDLFLIVLISLNVLATILESVEPLIARHAEAFQRFELFSVLVFTLEYFLRLWSSPDAAAQSARPSRLKFALSPGAIIDLLAILPFYLSFFIGMDLRFLRAVRLIRVFKLTRYSTTMQVILGVIRAELGTFTAAFALMLVLLVLASSGMYLIEKDIQPDTFGSIPAAMWWAMATLTTVGYGDAIPVTPAGKLFGSCITLIGVGMVALPAGILASGFSEQLRRSREQWEDQLATALEDGTVDSAEHQALEDLRQRLGISAEDADLLHRTYLRDHTSHADRCPHCHTQLETPSRAQIH